MKAIVCTMYTAANMTIANIGDAVWCRDTSDLCSARIDEVLYYTCVEIMYKCSSSVLTGGIVDASMGNGGGCQRATAVSKRM